MFPGLVSDPSKEQGQETTLDDFEITLDADDQQALDDFLGPDDGGMGRETVAMAAHDADDEQDSEEEEEEEEISSETEEEERVDVTKMVENRREEEKRIEGTEEDTEKKAKDSQPEVKGDITVDVE